MKYSLKLFTDPIRYFTSLARQEGPVSCLQLGNRRFYLINDPGIIEDVLVTRAAKFEKFPRLERSKGLFGEGLLTSEGAFHLRQRRLIQPLFHAHCLNRYATEILAGCERVISTWSAYDEIDALEEMNRLTLDILSHTVLPMTASQASRMAADLEFILRILNRLVMPWGDFLLRLPLASTRRYRRALAQVNEVAWDLIRESSYGSVLRGRSMPAERAPNLVEMLLFSNHDGTTDLTLDQIRDEIVTMFVAGHDTTANGLAWTLSLLARNPGLQDGLADEIEAAVNGDELDADAYSRLPGLRNVFAESMRLYPPVWILGRRALEPYGFEGFEAPEGSVLLISTAVLHRRPEFFDDPDGFRPDRWLSPTWPKYAYLPFGAGARQCAGERFAWLEGVLCLAAMLKSFRFETLDSEAPEPLGLLTLRPRDPVRLRLRARESRLALAGGLA